VDRSGTISAGEAFLLGTALSLDAFGAGIGAALVGFPPILTAVLIAASSGLFLWWGTKVGFWASKWRWVRQLSMLPGIILITMGILKLFV
jgi:putative sporulation protein YtaF